MSNENEEVAKRGSFKWFVQNTPGFRILFGQLGFIGFWVAVGGFVGLVTVLRLEGGHYVPTWVELWLVMWGFVFAVESFPLLGLLVMGWAILLPVVEVFIVLPMHWARRRQARKEGKDSYESVWVINCRYPV